ncbi:MAG: hypothetical protein V4524_01965 [Patescibacteria group bacterium]
MEKQPNSFEGNKDEDIYARGDLLNDYFNEIMYVGVNREGKIYRDKVKTIQEHYFDDPYAKADWKAEFEKYVKEKPKKVERVNKLVNILNTTNDVTLFKRAYNEILRLIYDREVSLMYPESEFNPDLLEL